MCNLTQMIFELKERIVSFSQMWYEENFCQILF
jgi:hypothetical protein